MDDLEYRIGKLALGPNDIVVIKSTAVLPREAIQRIGESMRHILGKDRLVLVLDKDMDISVLTRAEIEARAAP